MIGAGSVLVRTGQMGGHLKPGTSLTLQCEGMRTYNGLMPWKENSVKDEKVRIVIEYEHDEQPMTGVCAVRISTRRVCMFAPISAVWVRRALGKSPGTMGHTI